MFDAIALALDAKNFHLAERLLWRLQFGLLHPKLRNYDPERESALRRRLALAFLKSEHPHGTHPMRR